MRAALPVKLIGLATGLSLAGCDTQDQRPNPVTQIYHPATDARTLRSGVLHETAEAVVYSDLAQRWFERNDGGYSVYSSSSGKSSRLSLNTSKLNIFSLYEIQP